MRKVIPTLAVLLTTAVALAASHVPYIDAQNVPKEDVRAGALRDVVRVIDLADGSEAIIHRLRTAEPNAIGCLISGRGAAVELRASDLLPKNAIAAGTTGEIFGATLLDDNKTLALSIGWSNPSGRNINGIAVCSRNGAGSWTAHRILVFPGAVRDVIAGPGGTILAITTNALRSRAGGVAPVLTIVDPAGSARDDLIFDDRSSDALSDWAMGARLQRLSADQFAILSPGELRVALYHLDFQPFTPPSPADAVFAYPAARADVRSSVQPLRTVTLARPSSSADWKDVTLEAAEIAADGSVAAIWSGFDGAHTHVVAAAHDRSGAATELWSAQTYWRGIRVGGGVAKAVELGSPDSTTAVTATLR